MLVGPLSPLQTAQQHGIGRPDRPLQVDIRLYCRRCDQAERREHQIFRVAVGRRARPTVTVVKPPEEAALQRSFRRNLVIQKRIRKVPEQPVMPIV